MSFQQDFCVNSTVSRKICRGMEKKKRKKGVKYTKKRRFRGNQSVSRQSSVKQRRVRSFFDTLLTLLLLLMTVTLTQSQMSPHSSFRLE